MLADANKKFFVYLQKKEMPGKYINPFTDFGFKKIFGTEANKDLLIDFLNELLSFENQEIKDLTFKKNAQLPENEKERKVIYDLFCENEKGEKFIVEMQQAKQTYFRDRMLYYSTFSIIEQAPKGKIKAPETGEEKSWDYNLKAVYVVAILNFKIPWANKMEGKLLSRNKLLDVEDKRIFYDKLTFITLELPYFTKTLDELETNFDKWLYVLKHLETFDRLPEKIKTKIFEKLLSVAEYAKLTQEERLEYELSLSYYRDLYAMIDTAKEDGREEEREKLLPLLEQERREKEEAKRKEAEAQQKAEQERQKAEQERQKAEIERQEKELAKIKLAKKMKKYGEPIDEIIKETGLTKEQIENL